jgi:hypothetical protein
MATSLKAVHAANTTGKWRPVVRRDHLGDSPKPTPVAPEPKRKEKIKDSGWESPGAGAPPLS